MRDCLKNRGGFDRVLMAVAATFLTVSATSAMAQADPSRSSAAELAIDAAVPRPEPANVPPPTINDFKMDTTASVPDAAKTPDGKTETKPADVVTAPADASKAVPPNNTATAPSVTAPAATAAAAATPAAEPVKAASNVPAADQPVADKIKEMLSAKSLRYFERKVERADVEKFYGAREYAPIWTQAGGLTDSAGNTTLALSGTSFTFTVRRVTAGAATTVPFVVTDSCGAWPSLVGGGPNAF